MKKVFRMLSSVGLSAFLILGTLSGCGSSSTQGAVENKNPKQIVVWSHLQDKSEIPEVKKLAEEWAKKTGNKVKVIFDQNTFQSYAQAANGNKGPDIMFGIPHNDLGVFVKANLLAEVPKDFIDKTKYVDNAITAVTHSGKMFAVPLSMEAMALFYNTDKVKMPPTTFDEFIEQSKKVGFMYFLPDLYSSYAFFAGNGAYLFKNTNGNYDPNDIGLGNSGAVKGFTLMNQFVNEYKLISADITGDICSANFQSGKIGFILNGPWAVDGYKKAGINFAVTPLPKINGKIMPTFVGFQSAFVSSKSKNQTEAWDLMKYLIEKSPMILYQTGNRIPVLKSELAKPEVQDNKITVAFADQAKNGDPIPSIPEANVTWDVVKNNITLVITGKSTPEKAAQDTLQQIRDGIKIMNQTK